MNVFASSQKLVRSAQKFGRFGLIRLGKYPTKLKSVSLDSVPEQPHLSVQLGDEEIVNVGADRGVLRLQFPSCLSKQYWGKTQKYLYLGLSDTPGNRLIAELISRDIQIDIGSGCLDVSCNRYLESVQAYQPEPQKQPRMFPSKILNSIFKRETVLSLFDKYCEYKKPIYAETTIKEEYHRFRRYLSECPQNLEDTLEIQRYIVTHHAPCRARRIIGALANAIEWGKLNQLVPADFINVFKQYRADIVEISQRETAQSIQALIHTGYMHTDDLEFRAFTIEEANAIIEAFEDLICQSNRSGTPWDLVVKFLFWTGCRHGECAGLKWSNVSADCSKITFRASYSYRSRVLKGLKTQGRGVKSRSFPCGPKLKNLLLSIRPESCDLDTFVFSNHAGEAINFGTFHTLWVGSQKKAIVGILPTLIKAGKVHQYLPPYKTRHTYINAQLLAGVRPAYIAQLVGNSSATIHQYYESVFREEDPTIEF